MFGREIPLATYRLQFNPQFGFTDTRALVPYLYRLGISDLYSSPILKARAGSMHGYDITNPSQLNPELGTRREFEALMQTLKKHEMGLLLDVVPNHMAASPENPWWTDLLENGLFSPYASFFDIDWSALNNRILVPILNCPYEQALQNREIILTLEDAGLFVQYQGYRLPLQIKSYRLILAYCLNTLESTLGTNHPDFQQLNQIINTAQGLVSGDRLDPDEANKHYRERQAVKESFRNIVKTSSRVKTCLLQSITLFNGKKGEPKSFELMHNLLEEQVYQLALWKTAHEHLNYRRFFNINDLIGVRVEESPVFAATHSLILRLIRAGKATGLRIDHIDGLKDPLQYLIRLQQQIATGAGEKSISPRFYIIVEKILAGDELLPMEWPVCGTTGYDFATMINALFVDSRGAQALDESYSRFTGSSVAFANIVYAKKKQVSEGLFPGELKALGQHLTDLAHQDSHTVNLSSPELTRTLIEVTACLPVYRTYIRTLEVSPQDRLYLEHAVDESKRRNPNIDTGTIDFLQRILSLDFPDYLSAKQRMGWLEFVLRWQQLTGAIMAKGFEDTALYTYNRLVSLNEVGGKPDSPGLSVDEFHRRARARRERWPHTLNATSTHDTKRSEDVRARINVLSEISEEWERRLVQWHRWNQPKKREVNGLSVPEPNIEILLYQTLLGAWPLSSGEVSGFKERLKAYLIKAVREAKVLTDWLSPASDYESALITFLESILENSPSNDFLEDFLQFEKQIAFYGALNSLSQVLLKITLPGVPDFYQGTELWEFSLVDPDNRRPVDFKRRERLLDDLIQQEGQRQNLLIPEVLNSWEDGRVKLYVTCQALNARKSLSALFQNGDYLTLQASGPKQNHVCAFARRSEDTWVLIAVPRLTTGLVSAGTFPLGYQIWGDDRLLLPENTPESWLNIFTGEKLEAPAGRKALPLADVLHEFPVALLKNI